MTFYNVQRYARVSCTGNFPSVKKQIENSQISFGTKGQEEMVNLLPYAF